MEKLIIIGIWYADGYSELIELNVDTGGKFEDWKKISRNDEIEKHGPITSLNIHANKNDEIKIKGFKPGKAQATTVESY